APIRSGSKARNSSTRLPRTWKRSWLTSRRPVPVRKPARARGALVDEVVDRRGDALGRLEHWYMPDAVQFGDLRPLRQELGEMPAEPARRHDPVLLAQHQLHGHRG